MYVLVLLLVIAFSSMPSPTHADEVRHEIHLSTRELIRSVESLPRRHPLDPEQFLDSLVRYLEEEEIGVGPLLTLLPPDSAKVNEIGDVAPPRFALVARAHGRTIISLTQPGSTADDEDKVLLQRWLVSDLVKGHQYSLTVYEEHTLDNNAMRFLGVGARFILRPDIEFLGWHFGFEMYGSYHPDYEATAYLALTGKRLSPSVVPLTGAPARPGRHYGALVPLQW